MIESPSGIAASLTACVSPAPDRDAVSSFHDWFVLRSHPGLVRAENEDRALVVRWMERDESCWVVGVADGIGSGRVGAEAASIALAQFAAALVHDRRGLVERLAEAAELANQVVFDRWRGKEGTTLSAVLVRGQQAALVNIGDSRIYGIDRDAEIVLLTRDDILPTVPGLLQFVGMGKDLTPHVHPVAPRFARVLLTSDGAHGYLDPLLPHLVRAAKTDLRAFVDRVIHIATWCGGGDNATIIMASLSGGGQESAPSMGIDAWTPGLHHKLPDIDPSISTSGRWLRSESGRARRQDLAPRQRDLATAFARPQEARSPAVTIQFTDDDSQALGSEQAGTEDQRPEAAAAKAEGDAE